MKQVNNNVTKLPLLNGARSKLEPPPEIKVFETSPRKRKHKYSEMEDFDEDSNFRGLELLTNSSDKLRMTKISGKS